MAIILRTNDHTGFFRQILDTDMIRNFKQHRWDDFHPTDYFNPSKTQGIEYIVQLFEEFVTFMENEPLFKEKNIVYKCIFPLLSEEENVIIFEMDYNFAPLKINLKDPPSISVGDITPKYNQTNESEFVEFRKNSSQFKTKRPFHQYYLRYLDEYGDCYNQFVISNVHI